ncbi:monothiol glutaredoxin-S6-like [Populus trichocarpa]|uniref:Glutaredoxin 27 n=2 Tax=Populus trichocarpa TaxID=3694 RepID=A0A4Y1PNI7_POPTR|nr:monothiol glutaredoxin-S6-like [Populus trichocarpa]AYR16682.1 glutaredoxin 27 [Populus trichocarpa]
MPSKVSQQQCGNACESVMNVLIQEHNRLEPVITFSKSSCYMSHSIESLIRGFGANLTVYELDKIPNGQQIERALVQLGFRQGVPVVFIGQQLVGNERKEMSLHVQKQTNLIAYTSNCNMGLE